MVVGYIIRTANQEPPLPQLGWCAPTPAADCYERGNTRRRKHALGRPRKLGKTCSQYLPAWRDTGHGAAAVALRPGTGANSLCPSRNPAVDSCRPISLGTATYSNKMTKLRHVSAVLHAYKTLHRQAIPDANTPTPNLTSLTIRCTLHRCYACGDPFSFTVSTTARKLYGSVTAISART